MRFTLRRKLFAIVGVAILNLVITRVANEMISTRVSRQINEVQARTIPRVALGPRVEARLERLRRALQDAVSASDADALAQTRPLLDELLADLDHARALIDPDKLAALRPALTDYYAVASDISRRLIAGETGEELVEAMGGMQARQARAEALLTEATAFDEAGLEEAFAATNAQRTKARAVVLYVNLGILVFTIGLTLWLGRGVMRSLAGLTAGLRRFGAGDFSRPVPVATQDEVGDVAIDANRMAENLRRLGAERDRSASIRGAQAGLAGELQGALDPEEVAARAARFLSTYLDVPGASVYIFEDDQVTLIGGHMSDPGGSPRASLDAVTAAARQTELVLLDGLEGKAGWALLPLIVGNRVSGVLELTLGEPWTELHSETMRAVRQLLATSVEVARARQATRELLAETVRMTQRLSRQEEELRATNDQLQERQEALTLTNDELEKKARELATVSSYKSQFLANMSHELRTPLNSMLLLSNLLSENQARNLTDKQVEYSRTIYSAGRDLLQLINQVLDLAKIEAGKQQVRIGPTRVADLADRARRVFEPLARDKGLAFQVEIAPGLPEQITTDGHRVEQIINNLVGNAIKFTSQGEVTLRLGRPAAGVELRRPDLDPARALALSVTDTGRGIAPADLRRVFAPFEQVENTIDRRYGGTGLGLTIARELAMLLGGELLVQSKLGQGSTFTCVLPFTAPPKRDGDSAELTLGDGREARILVVEQKTGAGSLAVQIAAEGLAVKTAAGLAAARTALGGGQFDTVVVDLGLPDAGAEALAALAGGDVRIIASAPGPLDPAVAARVEEIADAVIVREGSASTRLSGELRRLLRSPRPSASLEPVGRRPPTAPQTPVTDVRLEGKRVLVVDDDMRTVYALSATLHDKGIEVLVADSGARALEMLDQQPETHLVLMDIMMPEMDGFEAMRRIRLDARFLGLPIIALTAKAMKGDRERCLDAGATDYLPKPIESDRLLGLLASHLGPPSLRADSLAPPRAGDRMEKDHG